ncbi:uL30 family ribosomal protein [Nanoarchaeota archaeon]
MIAIVRISGDVGLKREIRETLHRLKLKRKYSCVVLEPTKENLGMIKKVKDFVAFGEIKEVVYKKLVDKRKTKIKNFFRLHPPRGGIDSKKHFGVNRGVLGNNKEKINELIERML